MIKNKTVKLSINWMRFSDSIDCNSGYYINQQTTFKGEENYFKLLETPTTSMRPTEEPSTKPETDSRTDPVPTKKAEVF